MRSPSRSARTASLVAVVFAGAAAAPAPAAAKAPADCVYERPCVFVDKDIDPSATKAGTVLTFRGRGWRPRGQIMANYGAFCPPKPDSVCPAIGYGTPFKADRRGRFVFRFRYGRRPPRAGRGPVAAGGGEVSFAGLTPRGRHVERTAVPPPPRSTRRQRREAARVRDAVRALLADLERASNRTWKTLEAYQRENHRCKEILEIEEPPRQAAVIERVLDAALEAATYGEDAREFERFAARLDRLRITDPVLAAGAAVWVREIRAPRYVPQPSMCAVLRAWRDTGFALEAEPVDPTDPGLSEAVTRDEAIEAAVRRLRDLGIRRADQDLFAGQVFGLEIYLGA